MERFIFNICNSLYILLKTYGNELMIKILILCRGNITRSPFVSGYLNFLYRNSPLFKETLLDFDSSGIEGRHSRPVHSRILERGLEIGFDLGIYRSKHSTLKEYEKADLIFTLDSRQYERFTKVYSHLLEKTYHLYAFGRDEKTEVIDFEDPSELNNEEAFQKFFLFTEAEIKRVWEYFLTQYEKCKAEKIPFKAEVFYKKNLDNETTARKYGYLTRRFFPYCPFCQSKRIRRVKRQSYLQKRIWPKLNGYPYHCGNCEKTFILFIGADIKSSRRQTKKEAAWAVFEEKEKKLLESDNN